MIEAQNSPRLKATIQLTTTKTSERGHSHAVQIRMQILLERN